jgi:PEP-CTERM motif
MRVILVRLTLMLCLSAGTAYADPIKVSVFNGSSGAISDLSVSGNQISFDLAFGLSGPLYLMVKGLDARENYQVTANLSGPPGTNLTAEILTPAPGGGNQQGPNTQPAYVPAGFSTSTDYDGFSVAQGSALERSFLLAGESGLGVLATEFNANAPVVLPGNGNDLAVMLFGVRGTGGGKFLIGLDPGHPLATPEPGAMLLVGTGLVAVARVVRKRRSRA